MENKKKISKTFISQEFKPEPFFSEKLEYYKNIAKQYAENENAIAVLSDLKSNKSYLYYGKFYNEFKSEFKENTQNIDSIWEEELLQRMHPEDLNEKFIQELLFYHHIKNLPKENRFDFYLVSKLRMQNKYKEYCQVLHRMFYFPDNKSNLVWLSLCLYNPLVFDFPGNGYAVNSKNGLKIELSQKKNTGILTKRETEILQLIDKGMMSKTIAERLSISINTVSRHRQDILEKLQVKNSIEACRVAKDLKLL